VCASLSQSGGEITFLSMSHYYNKNVVSAWSSGTGAAGIAGALTYLLLTSVLGLTSFAALMIITVLPLGILFSAYVLLTGNHSKGGLIGPFRGCLRRIRGKKSGQASRRARRQTDALVEASMTPTVVLDKAKSLTLKERILHLLPLGRRYMLPLFIVYWAE
jgi:battenin